MRAVRRFVGVELVRRGLRLLVAPVYLTAAHCLGRSSVLSPSLRAIRQAKIRINSKDRATPIMLDFGTNFDDRDAIRDVLNRRLTPDGAAGAGAAPAPEPKAAPAKPAVDLSALPAEERNRRRVLLQKKEVADLYRRLVGSEVVDDEKFWKAIKLKYKPNGQRRGATAAELESSRGVGADKGVPSTAFVTTEEVARPDNAPPWEGETPSPADRHRVFMDHPAVALAYRAKVLDAQPGARMTEKAFWSVYMQSSMAQRHVKGTKRAAKVATEADVMFAEFHAQEHTAAEASDQRRAAAVDPSINMDRFDDHRQVHVRDAHDIGTGMVAAKRKRRNETNATGETRGLELMRRLNMHGTMVLDGVNDGESAAWREADDLRAHPFRHLEGTEAPAYAKLALENEQAFLAAQAGVDHGSAARGAGKGAGASAAEDLPANLASRVSAAVQDWTPSLALYGNGMEGNKATLDCLLDKMKT